MSVAIVKPGPIQHFPSRDLTVRHKALDLDSIQELESEYHAAWQHELLDVVRGRKPGFTLYLAPNGPYQDADEARKLANQRCHALYNAIRYRLNEAARAVHTEYDYTEVIRLKRSGPRLMLWRRLDPSGVSQDRLVPIPAPMLDYFNRATFILNRAPKDPTKLALARVGRAKRTRSQADSHGRPQPRRRTRAA